MRFSFDDNFRLGVLFRGDLHCSVPAQFTVGFTISRILGEMNGSALLFFMRLLYTYIIENFSKFQPSLQSKIHNARPTQRTNTGQARVLCLRSINKFHFKLNPPEAVCSNCRHRLTTYLCLNKILAKSTVTFKKFDQSKKNFLKRC